MAANLGQLTLDLVAKTGSFTGPLDKASRHAKKTSQDISKYGKAIGTAIGAGAVAAVAGITLLVNRQLDLIDQQAKAAQMLDTTYASIINLGRAGDLAGVGFEKINAASRQLNINLGRAIQGTDAQVDAFNRLGLSAQEVYDLPLDQRIATINKALTDNVQASERAAVAADIFGAKNAKAIQQLDPATIAEAARQVEIFGLNLSDIDAAKVELAGDALSTFGLLSEGIATQLTVELAPVLQAIGEEFLRSAEAAGGLGNVVQETTRQVISAAAAVADAGDGVARVFSVVANTLVGIYSTAVADINALSAQVASALAALPNFLGGAGFAEQAKGYREDAEQHYEIARQAAESINESLTKPLAGERLLKFYDDAQQAAEGAAAASVDGRKQALEGGKAFVDTESAKAKAAQKTQDAIESQIEALQLQVAVLGLNTKQETLYKLAIEGANAEQLKQAEIALNAVDAFEQLKKAKEEDAATTVFTDALRDQVELAQNAVDIEVESIGLGEKRANQLRAINQIQQEYAKSVEDLARAQGTADALSDEAYQARIAALKDAMEQEVQIVEEGERRKDEARQSALNGALRSIENYIDSAKDLASQTEELVTGVFSGLEDALFDFAMTGKLSFNDLANSIIADILRIGARQLTANLAGGLLGAFAGGGAIGPATTSGFSFGSFVTGQAHDGIMSVPSSGTWNLEKGERVMTADTSAKLDATLARIGSGRTDNQVMQQNGDVYMTVVTPDANSFRKSERQVSHSLRRGLNQ